MGDKDIVSKDILKRIAVDIARVTAHQTQAIRQLTQQMGRAQTRMSACGPNNETTLTPEPELFNGG